MLKKYSLLSTLAVLILLSGLFHPLWGKDALFKGQVLDESGDPLQGANIILKGSSLGAATDQKGQFLILAPAGSYDMEITFIGYAKVQEKIELDEDKPLEKTYRLKIEFFEIGGIVVYAEKELLPSDATTTTRISAGEIDHIQASSLSDVLKLVPGQRFDNPGLQDVKQVSIRTGTTDDTADRNAYFGTQVIIDGVAVNNNANMQIDTKANSGTVTRTTANSGIDLRQVPADNIEEVEVIRGIPSAKYGDLTSGIINVKTKTESIQHRIKYKYNLQNKELNYHGGFKIFEQYLNYNLNYANSLRDIRIDDFDYTRIAGQISHSTRLFKNLYSMQNRFYYTRTFDEQGLREGDLTLSEKYNRDFVIRYNHNSRFILTPHQKLEFAYTYNLNRQNSFGRQLVSGDITYITDRMAEGTQEGLYIQNYMSELWVKGKALTQTASLDYQSDFRLLAMKHNVSSGLAYRSESNNGPGRVFNPGYPPGSNSSFRDRPRSYNDIPALLITSLYLEDKISGTLWKPYQLNLGFRYERYGSGDGLSPANHGAFLNPRLNLVITPSENSQLRIGYGTTSKSPSLSMLYPNRLYFDLDDVNIYHNIDSLRQVIVSTYIFDRQNPDLQGTQQIKREISYDQKIGKLGFTATAYSSSLFGGFASTRIEPIFLYKYDYPDWPGIEGKTIRDSVYTTYSIFENSQNSQSRGFEFSIQTKSFSPLSMRLRLEAAYNATESQTRGFDFSSAYLHSSELNRDVLPFWNRVEMKSESFLINYKLEFTIKQLGAWVTLEAQQVVLDKSLYSGLEDSLAVGYITDNGVSVYFDESERTPDMPSSYKRLYDDYWYNSENQKNVWLFNLRVSKALFKGSEISFFVNNIFNSHPLYQRQRVSAGTVSYQRLNPDLFFGVEYSGVINDFFK